MCTWVLLYNDLNLFFLSLIMIFLNVFTTYSQLLFFFVSPGIGNVNKVKSINWPSIFFYVIVWQTCIPIILWTYVNASGIDSSFSAVGSNKLWIFGHSAFDWPSMYDDVGGRSVVSKSFSILLRFDRLIDIFKKCG